MSQADYRTGSVAPKFELGEVIWLTIMVVAIMATVAFAAYMLSVHLITNL